MPRPHYALAALALLAWPMAIWGQTALTPQAGLLVLRNGQVLEGEVTQAGDFYVVTLGGTSEIRLPAADVEAVCGSLDEAYEFKARHPSGGGVRPHLDLADWCLRHRLHRHCAEQLVAAMRLEPDNAQLRQLERRLELAVQTPAAAKSAAPASAATVGAEELEKTLGGLPSGSVEKFSAIVQPLLLNRCGANQCHGPNSKAEFKLLRPAAGQLASRRFTQRNLYAALQHLDAAHPEASPLLTMPQGRHGTSLTAVFDKQSQKQLAELAAWVEMTLASPAATAPATIAQGQTTLSQSGGANPAASPAEENPAGSASVSALKPTIDGNSPKPSASAGDRFIPRDRFDPEIFNRRFAKGERGASAP